MIPKTPGGQEGYDHRRRSDRRHITCQRIRVAQAFAGVAQQVKGIQQGIDDGPAGVGVVDRRIVNVRKAVQGNRIVRLRDQAVGLGELAQERIVIPAVIVVQAGRSVKELAGKEPLGHGGGLGGVAPPFSLPKTLAAKRDANVAA